MTTNIYIGDRVKMLREKSGLSQNQIASFLGVDQSYISKCEANERQFNLDSLEKLSNLFGCTLTDLMNEESLPTTLSFAFRSNVIEKDDLVVITDINKIALNIYQMRKLLESN